MPLCLVAEGTLKNSISAWKSSMLPLAGEDVIAIALIRRANDGVQA